MARRWTKAEENKYRTELRRLYVRENKTISEIAKIFHLAEQTVFDRLKRLGIASNPQRKLHYLNRRSDIRIPKKHTEELAEFFGMMLGDGHVSQYQVIVCLGSKEEAYADYVAALMEKIFGMRGHIAVRYDGYRDVYFGSVDIVRWLLSKGLVHHKVKRQVDVPRWLFSSPAFSHRFLRGFFDTDGSVYKLKFGIQISFSNNSMPLLASLRDMLIGLGYQASRISAYRVYLTRRGDVERFFREAQPQNPKHLKRFEVFWSQLKAKRR